MRRALILAALVVTAGCTQQPGPARRVAAAGGLPLAEFVLVDKSERTLTLFAAGQAFRTYRAIQLGDAPEGHKQFQGDERTPEGRYVIDYGNARSSYHLSLHISYPNGQDRVFARSYGRSPGGDIFIHGQPNGLPTGRVAGDWTDGCIALSNAEIEELWQLVPDGTPIEIRA